MNRPARATQGEIARALRAAKEAGPNYAVEVLPDGTIRIAPVQPPPWLAPEPDLSQDDEEIVL